MWLMAIAAFRDGICLFRSVRHVIVWGDPLPARRQIARDLPCKMIERPVTFQTHVLGDFGGGGAANPQAQYQRENKHFKTHESKSCFCHFPHPVNSVWKWRPQGFQYKIFEAGCLFPLHNGDTEGVKKIRALIKIGISSNSGDLLIEKKGGESRTHPTFSLL